MRRLVSLVFVFIMIMGMETVNASTNNVQTEEEIVFERTFYDELTGATVTEIVTRSPYRGTLTEERNIEGTAHYRKSDTYTWSAGTVMTYYIEGDFAWNDDEDYISASNVSGNVYNVPSSVTISNRDTTTEYGQYFFFFNRYVDVEFSFTATNIIGISQNFSISMRVSQEGVFS